VVECAFFFTIRSNGQQPNGLFDHEDIAIFMQNKNASREVSMGDSLHLGVSFQGEKMILFVTWSLSENTAWLKVESYTQNRYVEKGHLDTFLKGGARVISAKQLKHAQLNIPYLL
jgi:hypothetical protein